MNKASSIGLTLSPTTLLSVAMRAMPCLSRKGLVLRVAWAGQAKSLP